MFNKSPFARYSNEQRTLHPHLLGQSSTPVSVVPINSASTSAGTEFYARLKCTTVTNCNSENIYVFLSSSSSFLHRLRNPTLQIWRSNWWPVRRDCRQLMKNDEEVCDEAEHRQKATRKQNPGYIVTKYGRLTTTKSKNNPKMSVQLSNEQFERLLAKISTATSQPKPTQGSFTTCKYSYNGNKGSEVVEAFLSAINIFKRAETSMISLPYLYRVVPKKNQGPDESTEDFVRHKRLLFSQLPEPSHPETQQLDMIYGLLSLKIRDKVPRSGVNNFDDLLKEARATERLLSEQKKDENAPTEEAQSEGAGRQPNAGKSRCKYCKYSGHDIENCRIKQRKDKLNATETNRAKSSGSSTEAATTQAPSPSAPKFSCYGCGTPGVVRSNCTTCHKGKSPMATKSTDIGFCAIGTTTDARDRPVIPIEVDGTKGIAFIDTCAKSSIASYELYCCLKSKGYHFTAVDVGVTLADGIPKKQNVMITKVPVKVNGRTVLTTFLVLPESRENRTLLGVGFIQDAHIVLDFTPVHMVVLEEPDNIFELYKESFLNYPNVTVSSVRMDLVTSPSLPEGSQTSTLSDQPYGPLIPLTLSPLKRKHSELLMVILPY
ncbi:uncharacterized protein [Maniola hyperantus]|uniref:uncharacterized protein n=1 Tax=Aphantopus hyperantus TaxID=2795564 RepID=UPI003748F10F